MQTEGLGATIMPIILMVLVIAAAYYTTRAISTKSQKINRGKFLQIVDRIILGKDKQIVLLKAGDSVYMIGVTGQNMTSIGSLDNAQLEQLMSTESQKSEPAIGLQGMLKHFGSLTQIKNAVPSTDQWLKQRIRRSQTDNKRGSEFDNMMQAIEARRDRMRRSETEDGNE